MLSNRKAQMILAGISAAVYMQEQTAAAPVAATPVVATEAVPVITLMNAADPYLSQSFKFHFKKDELGNKRSTIELALPILTREGLIQALDDEKITSYILDVLSGESYKAARQQVGAEEKPVNTQEELDVAKLTVAALANLPKAERTGGGISKETWADFNKDYIEVMPGVTGKTAEQVGNAAKLLIAKFQPVKTNKKVIAFLRDQLAQYFSSTPNAEDFQECYEFLDNKAQTLLEADEAKLLENL